MRILQVSNRVPWPLNEGGTLGIYHFTKAFAKAGHQVTLYCLDGLKHKTDVQAATAALSPYCKLYIHGIDTDVKWTEALKSLVKGGSYNVERFVNESFRQELIALLKNEKFEVVQVEGTYAAPYIE